MRRMTALLACLTSICLTATACSGSSKPSSTSSGSARYATDGTFTMAALGDLGSFDPYKSNTIYGYSSLAYDTLVNLQPDGTIVSGLAQTWKADAQSATFTLESGITCSDGSALTASQVASDLSYLGDASNGNIQYGVNIPPGAPYAATGDDATRTVTVTMKTSFGFMLNTFGRTPIVCAKGMANRASLQSSSDGTGPFVLTNVVPGQSYTLTVRKGYAWGPNGAPTSTPGTPGKVVIEIVANQTTAANLLLSGGLNFALIDGPDQQRLKAAGLSSSPFNRAALWLMFNHLNNRPTSDPLVREALVIGLDSRQVIPVSTGGNGTASRGLVALTPSACPGDTVKGQLPTFDQAKADSLLDQAGWTKGTNGVRMKNGQSLTLDLVYEPSLLSTYQASAELIAQEWGAIGVKVKLTALTPAAFGQTVLGASNFDVYAGSFGVSLPSQIVSFLSGPVPPKGSNFSGIDNSQYNALVAKAATLPAPSACTYWNQAEQALYKNVDIAPISNDTQPEFLNKAEGTTNNWEYIIPTSIRVVG
ncbi:MAG: extracellular solute-binding protein family 5 [Pseudonocardiales bacterium]|nr:extracellular solute-binding protein family 5 [Pseudonocardiales bacterium]